MLNKYVGKKTPFFLLLPLVGVVYIFLGKVSLFFATMPEGIAIAWFPNGFFLSLFLLYPYKEWKCFALIIFPAEIIADVPSFSVLQAFQFACVNLAETLASAWLLRKIAGDQDSFQHARYVLLFIVFALALIPSISAIFGALIYHTQIESQTDFIAFWRIWFFGDSLGTLLLAPLLVSWLDTSRKFPLSRHYMAETLITNSAVLFLTFSIFSQPFNPSILPTTPMIFILLSLWIVYRQGLRLSMLLGFCIGLIGVYYTVGHKGPFSVFSAVENTLYLQEFLAALMTSVLFFGVLLRQVNNKNQELLESNKALQVLTEELEKRVDEKTQALQKVNDKLQELAIKDALTGIYNRYYLQQFLNHEIPEALRHHYPLSIILFDIDFFKKINDTYGHQVGDMVLVSIAEAISTRLRKEDIFARIGGEEFVVVLPHIALESAITLAHDIKSLIASLRVETKKHEVSCTISAGVSMLSEDLNTFDSLYEDADKKLYLAKSSGRNCVV